MCLFPVTLVRPKEDWINNVPDSHTRIVPCGKCVQCLKRRASAWTLRLTNEMRQCSSAAFVTLTYENVPLSSNGLPTLKKKDFQDFMKRLRRNCHGHKLKYYACGEYSPVGRPHYHAIIFNMPMAYITDIENLTKTWTHGIVHCGIPDIGGIHYVTGYVTKGGDKSLPDHVDEETGEILIEDDRQREFPLMSKGMGLNYLTPQMVRYHKENLIGFVIKEGGVIQGLPRYYKDKIFDAHEKIKIANEYKEIQEHNFEKFVNSWHELQWKKDQLRKQEKDLKLKRQKL